MLLWLIIAVFLGSGDVLESHGYKKTQVTTAKETIQYTQR